LSSLRVAGQAGIHRETTVTAPVLDSTRHYTNHGRRPLGWSSGIVVAVIAWLQQLRFC